MTTVVSVDPSSGKLVNTNGQDGEAGRFSRFAKRMLSTDPGKAVLDYGASGASSMEVKAGSSQNGIGARIDLKAFVVNVPGEFRIGDENVKSYIARAVEEGLERIYGASGEIEVSEVEQSGDNPSRFIVSLSSSITDHLSSLDNIISKMFASDYADTIGDGLMLSDGDSRLLQLRLGEGLTFDGPVNGERAVAVEGSTSAVPKEEFFFKDHTTEDVYKLYIDNGDLVQEKINIEEKNISKRRQ